MAIDDYYKNISPLQSTQVRSKSTALDPALQSPAQAGGGQWMQQQYNQLGPRLVQAAEKMPGALQAANEATQRSYDAKMGLSEGYIGTLQEPHKNDQWGRFGAALLKPTSTGSFAEGFGNAATAAMDARDTYRDKEAQRKEKLYLAQYALEGLRADKPNAELQNLQDTIGMVDTFGKVGGLTADMQLGNGLTPTDDAALLDDYRKNPNKYAGQRGIAMVQAAQASLSKATEHQRQIELERVKAGLKDKPYVPDAGSRKAIRENDTSSVVLKQSLNNLNRAFDLAGAGQSNMGYFAKERAGVAEYVPDWMAPDAVFGSPEQGRNTGELAQIMELEAIKGVGEFLKGPTSDRDVKLMLDTLADPNASPERKQAAIDRVKRQVEAQIAFNNEYNTELKTGEAYGTGGGGGASSGGDSGYLTPEGQINLQALPQSAQDWVQSQLAKGVEEEKIVQILMERINGAGE